MTDLERSLLNIVQHDFPLERRPFLTIARRLNISESLCITMLDELRRRGILRDIRPVLSWNTLGLSTILVGAKIAPPYMDTIAEEINQIEGVTHNYEREGAFDLWFSSFTKKLIINNKFSRIFGL
ncbi:MAG: Lrp/AsnC family transcriptional regulator [Chitinivibrionales bacterium]|nr:Lrp/AsnC family transcriptional regulator [Chitinivibrionales bacterium]MBD3358076.1 Lrp/AsnC family transcriptional regulator [Chitinivibrionales bacterium]